MVRRKFDRCKPLTRRLYMQNADLYSLSNSTFRYASIASAKTACSEAAVSDHDGHIMSGASLDKPSWARDEAGRQPKNGDQSTSADRKWSVRGERLSKCGVSARRIHHSIWRVGTMMRNSTITITLFTHGDSRYIAEYPQLCMVTCCPGYATADQILRLETVQNGILGCTT